MASEQVRRDNVADKRNTEVEKVVVPKMRTHYESLAEKAKSPQGSPRPVGSAEKVHQYETLPVGVGGTKAEEGNKWGRETREGVQREGEWRQGPSLEDISKLRATAQQNSMEAIRAAQERYEKAKESGASAVQKTKNSAGQGKDNGLPGIQTGGQYIADKSGALKDTLVEKGQQAKDYTAQKAVDTKDSISSKGGALKDTAVEKGQKAKDYTAQKAVEAKDYISSKGGALKDTAVEKGQRGKDYSVRKTVETKDAIASTGQSAAGYAADRAKTAKETTVDTAKNVASYVGERATAAKDATVEGGKGAAGYAGKVAAEAMDQAVAAGWGATHYTLEKVADATKAVAGGTSSIAGYTGDTMVAAKDKVAGAGQTTMDYAGEKLAAVKVAVVESEEKAAEYAWRKKVDAQKNLEEKEASREKGGRGETFETREEREASTGKFFHGAGEDEQMPRPRSGGGGSIFQAIGETLMEIGQTTKDLLVGQYPIQVLDHKDHEIKDKYEDSYRGAGDGI